MLQLNNLWWCVKSKYNPWGAWNIFKKIIYVSRPTVLFCTNGAQSVHSSLQMSVIPRYTILYYMLQYYSSQFFRKFSRSLATSLLQLAQHTCDRARTAGNPGICSIICSLWMFLGYVWICFDTQNIFSVFRDYLSKRKYLNHSPRDVQLNI